MPVPGDIMKFNLDVKLIGTISFTLLLTFIVAFIFGSMIKYSENTESGQAEKAKEAVRNAAIQCYALEGSYPKSIEYLADKYGVILDRDKYIYYYECQISNIMPDIIVMPKNTGK